MSQPYQGAQPQIIVVDASGVRRPAVVLTERGLTLGREAGNDILLEDPRISRRHARIDWDGRQVTVTDLGSSNGTTLGGVSLTPHAPQVWTAGQALRIDPFGLELAPADLGLGAATVVPQPIPQPIPPPVPPMQAQPPVQPAGMAAPVSPPIYVPPPEDVPYPAPPPPPGAAPAGARGGPNWRFLALVAGLAVVVIGIALALSGVFSGGDDDDADDEAGSASTPRATRVRDATSTSGQTGAGAEPTQEQVVISACGGTTIEYSRFDTEVPRNIDQWNRIVDAANPITDAWNEFANVMNTVTKFEQAANNPEVLATAANLQAAVETNRPTLEEETAIGTKFADLARAELATADAFAELAQMALDAAAGDANAWNASIDQFNVVSERIAASDAATAEACDYFQSISD